MSSLYKPAEYLAQYELVLLSKCRLKCVLKDRSQMHNEVKKGKSGNAQ